jgi:hypothetical protein
MPRKLQPISNAIQAKLEETRVARLATLDAEYAPHIVPVKSDGGTGDRRDDRFS